MQEDAQRWAGFTGAGSGALAITAPDAVPTPEPLLAWWTQWHDLALRLAMALAFLGGLGAALTVLAPPPPGPAVRLALPPPLPDPAALLPYFPETARLANAAVPVEPPTIPAPSYRFTPTAPDAHVLALARAQDCLAAAAWYEAGDDPSGMRAVAQVVLNRVRHPAFPASVCGVVFQGAERTTGCQFSFSCDGSMQTRHPGAAGWARARAVAGAALAGAVDPRVGLATHYHADYVVPVWRSGLVKLAQVGLHLFYRWPGTWGSPAVLRSAGAAEEPRIPQLAALSRAHSGADGVAATPLAAPPLAGAALSDPARPGMLAYQPLDETDGPPHLAAPGAASIAALALAPGAGLQTEHLAITLDPAAFPGSFGTRALALCADRPRCAVVGTLQTAPPGAPPAFLYVRDRRSGAEGAWWDCQTLPRANPTRCLPQGVALTRLLAQWR